MGLFSWTLTQCFLIFKHHSHELATSPRGYASFQVKVATSLMMNLENKSMHQRMSRIPQHPIRSQDGTSSSIPTGYYHSIEHYGKGRGSDETRKMRHACVVCPVDNTGCRNRVTTFCRECALPVHDICFSILHNNPQFARIRSRGHKETLAYLGIQ